MKNKKNLIFLCVLSVLLLSIVVYITIKNNTTSYHVTFKKIDAQDEKTLRSYGQVFILDKETGDFNIKIVDFFSSHKIEKIKNMKHFESIFVSEDKSYEYNRRLE